MKQMTATIALIWTMGLGTIAQARTLTLDRTIDLSPIGRGDFSPRRPPLECRNMPDLIISTIQEPVWNARARTTTIAVVVKNKGQVVAENFRVQLRDGTTIRTSFVTALGPASSRSIYFTLPYWVYNPDADFTVTADPTNRVRECSETNNVKEFFGLG